MSTKFNDGTNPFTFDHSIKPNSYTDVTTGQTIDLIECDGACIAIVSLVIQTIVDPISITFEESSDDSTWSAIATATSIEMADPFDGVVVRTFQRTMRYVRASLSTTIDNEVLTTVVIGQQKKMM